MENIFEQLFLKMKYLPTKNKTSNEFNIFKILGIENKEVLACRLLGELMSPHGAHGLGEKPLQLFLKEIGISDFTAESLKNATVVLEEKIDNDRRVDIVIYIKGFVVPIEVKIWADDQKNQLYDYYNYFNEQNRNEQKFKIYYLTPNGWEPSEFSACDLKKDKQYQCISFEKNISNWLKEILKNSNNDISATVKSILEQFQEVIKDMCTKDTNLQSIKKAIDFREGEFNTNDSLKALLYILEANQGNKLWKNVRNEYLRKNLKVDSKKYKLVDADEIPEGQKGECVFSIKSEKTKNIIAWICIETNLYIVAKKIKEDNQISWNGSEGYYWVRISPKGNGKAYNLRDPNPNILEDKEIDIERLLEQIEE